MPFCPNCRTEFADGVAECTDCGSELVAALPNGWNVARDPNAMRPAVLCELSDQVELGLVEAQLRAVGIPFVRRPRSVALYVPSAFLPRAQQVLEGEAEAVSPLATEDTLCLSELHRIRLMCSECEHETTVDLLAEKVPNTCPQCGHFFDLTAARAVLDRYTDLMRMMSDVDFEIELERPKEA